MLLFNVYHEIGRFFGAQTITIFAEIYKRREKLSKLFTKILEKIFTKSCERVMATIVKFIICHKAA